MINVKNAIRLPRRFWLINLLLISFYLWALTETTTITLAIQPNSCMAHTPERSLAIPCSGLTRGSVALYSRRDAIPDFLDGGPLDALALASAWQMVGVYETGGERQWQDDFRGAPSSWRVVAGTWCTRFGKLQPLNDT